MRDVRPGDSFTQQLKAALAANRGAVTRRHFDFYVYPHILLRFARDWDALIDDPSGLPGFKLLIEPIYPLHAVPVQGHELSTGVIELIGIRIDAIGLPDPETD